MDPDPDPDELKRQAERNIERAMAPGLQKAQEVSEAIEAIEARANRDQEVLDELRAIRKGIDKLVAAQGLQDD